MDGMEKQHGSCHAARRRPVDTSSKGGSNLALQPDGLPMLASHLSFAEHYDPEDHCPVCSLGKIAAAEGQGRQAPLFPRS